MKKIHLQHHWNWTPQPFNAGYTLKGHIYLNKLAAFSFRFVLVCMTFWWRPGIKGLTTHMPKKHLLCTEHQTKFNNCRDWLFRFNKCTREIKTTSLTPFLFGSFTGPSNDIGLMSKYFLGSSCPSSVNAFCIRSYCTYKKWINVITKDSVSLLKYATKEEGICIMLYWTDDWQQNINKLLGIWLITSV